MTAQTTCPKCAGRAIPILYGLPGPEAEEQARRGEVEIGGCMIGAGEPDWRCTKCGHGWRRPRRADRDAVVKAQTAVAARIDQAREAGTDEAGPSRDHHRHPGVRSPEEVSEAQESIMEAARARGFSDVVQAAFERGFADGYKLGFRDAGKKKRQESAERHAHLYAAAVRAGVERKSLPDHLGRSPRSLVTDAKKAKEMKLPLPKKAKPKKSK